MLIGNATGKPQIDTLTPGTGIAIKNGPGSITISQNGVLEATGQTVGSESLDLITLPLGSSPGTYTLEGQISGFEDSIPAGIGCKLFGAVRTTGTSGSLIDAVDVKCHAETTLREAKADMIVSGNNVIIRVKGVKGLTIDWSVHLEHSKSLPHITFTH